MIEHVKNNDIKEILKRMFQCIEEEKQLEINSFVESVGKDRTKGFCRAVGF